MWRFKPFLQKEQSGLEGRTIDVGNLKLYVRNIIAEGGFSCVYLARDAMLMNKQYALKHIICNDDESLQLVMKEISVMKLLRGHPNVVRLYEHCILDSGRTKEALLVMEFCEKSLVNVLDSRGAGFFEETQVLLIFRDICNAVFAMHTQSPPIAHRDLKAENLLLGSDGRWKLCDFGSTSTNHKRFEKPEEMGIEEDNIRKHTTPAYRAPEMWDLFLKELISEKVDIWALGCLLFRICYFKLAFDGESKLQVLNGNYRIPASPKYSSSVTELIRDMLQASPEARPDITQIWFRVNEQLPTGQQKPLPDMPPELQSTESPEGIANSGSKVSLVPRRSAPAPPSYSMSDKSALSHKAGGKGQLGAFWSSEHAKESIVSSNNSGLKFDEEPSSHRTTQHIRGDEGKNSLHTKEVNMRHNSTRRGSPGQPDQLSQGGNHKDIGVNSFQKDSGDSNQMSKFSKSETRDAFADEAFQSFVAEFDTEKFSSENHHKASQEALAAEVERLKEQLKQADVEKAEMTSKYEKLTAICRSQRQEIQQLKEALASKNPSPKVNAQRNQMSARLHSHEEAGGMSQDIRPMGADNFPVSEAMPWQAFSEDKDPRPPVSKDSTAQSVRTRNGRPSRQSFPVTTTGDSWGFESENFTAVRDAIHQATKAVNEGNISQLKLTEGKSATQPAGWSGF